MALGHAPRATIAAAAAAARRVVERGIPRAALRASRRGLGRGGGLQAGCLLRQGDAERCGAPTAGDGGGLAHHGHGRVPLLLLPVPLLVVVVVERVPRRVGRAARHHHARPRRVASPTIAMGSTRLEALRGLLLVLLLLGRRPAQVQGGGRRAPGRYGRGRRLWRRVLLWGAGGGADDLVGEEGTQVTAAGSCSG